MNRYTNFVKWMPEGAVASPVQPIIPSGPPPGGFAVPPPPPAPPTRANLLQEIMQETTRIQNGGLVDTSKFSDAIIPDVPQIPANPVNTSLPPPPVPQYAPDGRQIDPATGQPVAPVAAAPVAVPAPVATPAAQTSEELLAAWGNDAPPAAPIPGAPPAQPFVDPNAALAAHIEKLVNERMATIQSQLQPPAPPNPNLPPQMQSQPSPDSDPVFVKYRELVNETPEFGQLVVAKGQVAHSQAVADAFKNGPPLFDLSKATPEQRPALEQANRNLNELHLKATITAMRLAQTAPQSAPQQVAPQPQNQGPSDQEILSFMEKQADSLAGFGDGRFAALKGNPFLRTAFVAEAFKNAKDFGAYPSIQYPNGASVAKATLLQLEKSMPSIFVPTQAKPVDIQSATQQANAVPRTIPTGAVSPVTATAPPTQIDRRTQAPYGSALSKTNAFNEVLPELRAQFPGLFGS